MNTVELPLSSHPLSGYFYQATAATCFSSQEEFSNSCHLYLAAIKHSTDYIWLYFKNMMKKKSPR